MLLYRVRPPATTVDARSTKTVRDENRCSYETDHLSSICAPTLADSATMSRDVKSESESDRNHSVRGEEKNRRICVRSVRTNDAARDDFIIFF